MNTCPHCGRKLLSHISLRCNWCGVEIEDPTYRAQAEVERAAFRAEDALHSLQSLTILANTPQGSRLDQVGALVGAPFLAPPEDAATRAGRIYFEALERQRRETLLLAKQQKALGAAPAEEPADEAEDRFGHLEL